MVLLLVVIRIIINFRVLLVGQTTSATNSSVNIDCFVAVVVLLYALINLILVVVVVVMCLPGHKHSQEVAQHYIQPTTTMKRVALLNELDLGPQPAGNPRKLIHVFREGKNNTHTGVCVFGS